jgi:hypothetical protein
VRAFRPADEQTTTINAEHAERAEIIWITSTAAHAVTAAKFNDAGAGRVKAKKLRSSRRIRVVPVAGRTRRLKRGDDGAALEIVKIRLRAGRVPLTCRNT